MDDKRVSLNRRRFLAVAGSATVVVVPAMSANGATKMPANLPDDVVDVAIIGAGLAGLTAARDLRRAGCESFVVLEARDRVGGRTLNHDLGNGRFSEGGGQWIGPGQTAIADLTRELGIGTFPTYFSGKTVFVANDTHAAADLGNGFGGDPVLEAELDKMARDVPSGAPWTAPRAAELDRMSLGDWLSTKKLDAEAQISWNLSSVLSGGATPAMLGLLHFLSMINSAGSYVALEDIKGGAQETRFEGGSQSISLTMAKALGDKVRLQTPILKITNWQGPLVTLHTPTGVIRARRVILALTPALCHQIAFEPALPEPRRELQRLWPAYSPARKTVHVYDKPFWRDKGFNGSIVQAFGPLMWAYDNSPKDGSIGVINAFVVQSMLPSAPDAARDLLAAIYAQAFGKQALNPLQYHEYDWGVADRWSLSCVSAIPPGFWTRHGKALHPPVGRLIWSGTETADIWAGYMDGAVRSGHKAALVALQALRQA